MWALGHGPAVSAAAAAPLEIAPGIWRVGNEVGVRECTRLPDDGLHHEPVLLGSDVRANNIDDLLILGALDSNAPRTHGAHELALDGLSKSFRAQEWVCLPATGTEVLPRHGLANSLVLDN